MPDLSAIVIEIERHLAAEGWDQPPKLFSLVRTSELLANEPQLAELLADSDPEGLTPVEQPELEDDIAEVLSQIEWPPAVTGCAFVNEVFLLPDGAVAERPEETDPSDWAEQHPDKRDVRLAVAVVRGGEKASVLRIRGLEGEEDEVVAAPDLVPNLSAALLSTLE